MPQARRTRPTHSLPPTSRSLPIALMRAREKVMTPIRLMLADAGITEQQWRVLRVLDEFGALEASRLAERACLQLPSQSRIVQTLVEKGLVTRTNSASDRRKQLVAITPEGHGIIAANLEQAAGIAKSFEAVLGKKKLGELIGLLAELDRL